MNADQQSSGQLAVPTAIAKKPRGRAINPISPQDLPRSSTRCKPRIRFDNSVVIPTKRELSKKKKEREEKRKLKKKEEKIQKKEREAKRKLEEKEEKKRQKELGLTPKRAYKKRAKKVVARSPTPSSSEDEMEVPVQAVPPPKRDRPARRATMPAVMPRSPSSPPMAPIALDAEEPAEDQDQEMPMEPEVDPEAVAGPPSDASPAPIQKPEEPEAVVDQKQRPTFSGSSSQSTEPIPSLPDKLKAILEPSQKLLQVLSSKNIPKSEPSFRKSLQNIQKVLGKKEEPEVLIHIMDDEEPSTSSSITRAPKPEPAKVDIDFDSAPGPSTSGSVLGPSNSSKVQNPVTPMTLKEALDSLFSSSVPSTSSSIPSTSQLASTSSALKPPVFNFRVLSDKERSSLPPFSHSLHFGSMPRSNPVAQIQKDSSSTLSDPSMPGPSNPHLPSSSNVSSLPVFNFQALSNNVPCSSNSLTTRPVLKSKPIAKIQKDRTVSQSALQGPAPSTSSSHSISNASLVFAVPAKPTPIPANEEMQWRENITRFKRGGRVFINHFKLHEKKFYNGAVPVKIWENGVNYAQKIGDFSEIHLFKSKEGLELVIPEDLDYDTAHKYLNQKRKVNVINSLTTGSRDIKIQTLINGFKRPKNKRDEIWNSLSLEIGQTEDVLNNVSKVPDFVDRHSIVAKVENVLRAKVEVLKAKKTKTTAEKQEEKNLKHRILDLPRYQKFLLLSMEDSFTDIHVDFSATSVYYHVKKGRKVFYVAPPTPRNLQVYKDFEMKKRGGEEWIGEVLFKEWQRLDIEDGFTAMLPSGYLHFVYTPEDSIVIGGNFLMEQHLERQFEMTKLEEDVVRLFEGEDGSIKKEHLYIGFRNLMWAYAEYILIPQLEDSPSSKDLLEKAIIFVKGMNPKMELDEKGWYHDYDVEAFHDKLRTFVNSSKNQPSTSLSLKRCQPSTAQGPSPKKMK